MSRVLNVARFPGGGVPEIISYEYAGSNIIKGSVVEFSSGQVTLSSSTVSSGIVGISLEPQASKPGFEVSHDSQATQYTGRVAEVSVAIANMAQIFSGAGTNATPAVSHIGSTRALVLSGGVWTVDLTSSSSQAVTVVDVDLLEAIVFFKFLETAIAAS